MKLTAKFKERFRKVLHERRGKAVGFRVDEIRLPDGKAASREYLTHPGAVGALAFDARGRIILVKQFRYPVSEFTYEIPAGKLAVNEDPLDCIRRELEEETGVRARKIRKLAAFWPTAAFSDEVIHLYVATDLEQSDPHPDEDEYLELVYRSPAAVERMIRKGEIRDSKTLIAFWWWKNDRSRRATGSRRGR